MIVIDASVGNKLVLPNEDGHEAVKLLFRKHFIGEETLLVPDFFFYEVANTLATKSAIPSSQVILSLEKVYLQKLAVHQLHEKEVSYAARLAREHKTAVYDMLYLVLAEEKRCDLITADEKFVRQVRLSFVKLLQNL